MGGRVNDKIIHDILASNGDFEVVEKKYAGYCDFKTVSHKFYFNIKVMVETGMLNYTKMTPVNYYYWWYEEKDVLKNKPNASRFTADLNDFQITKKGNYLYQLKNLDYYEYTRYADLLVELGWLQEAATLKDFIEIYSYKKKEKLIAPKVKKKAKKQLATTQLLLF